MVGSNNLTVTYSDIQDDDPGSVPYGGAANGNIDLDPLFVVGSSGTWTAAGVYCSPTCVAPGCTDCDDPLIDVGQTLFTDTSASFTVGGLTDDFINPDTAQVLHSLIVGNTATQIVVWGDFSTIAALNDPYEIVDLHMQSPGSPCIDAADNNVVALCGLDLDGNERFVDDPATLPTGNPAGEEVLVDMGAYEFASVPLTDCNANALEDDCEIVAELAPDCNENDIPDECDIASGTSLDCQGTGVPDDCCPADFGGDDTVGAFDLAGLLAAWGPCP